MPTKFQWDTSMNKRPPNNGLQYIQHAHFPTHGPVVTEWRRRRPPFLSTMKGCLWVELKNRIWVEEPTSLVKEWSKRRWRTNEQSGHGNCRDSTKTKKGSWGGELVGGEQTAAAISSVGGLQRDSRDEELASCWRPITVNEQSEHGACGGFDEPTERAPPPR